MKLKEKFLDHVYCFMGSGMLTNTYDEDIANWNAEKCEFIAENFAINFAKWVDKFYFQGHDNNKYYKSEARKNEGEVFTIRQLLKLYKKEKGL
jgi:hypothetical protein